MSVTAASGQLESASAQAVRTPEPDRLTDLVIAEGGKAIPAANGNGNSAEPGDHAPVLTVTGVPAPRIGELAASASIVLHELTPQLASLEEAFLELTSDSLEFGHLTAEPASQSTEGNAR